MGKLLDAARELAAWLRAESPGMPMVVHIPDGKGKFVRYTVHSIDELRRLQSIAAQARFDEMRGRLTSAP